MSLLLFFFLLLLPKCDWSALTIILPILIWNFPNLCLILLWLFSYMELSLNGNNWARLMINPYLIVFFHIKPTILPPIQFFYFCRMGLLVTLFLVLINIFNSVRWNILWFENIFQTVLFQGAGSNIFTLECNWFISCCLHLFSIQ